MLFLTISILLAATSAMFIKKSKNIAGSGYFEGTVFMGFVAVFSIIVFLLVNLFHVKLYAYNYLFSFLYAFLGALNTLITLKAFSCGKVSTFIFCTTIGATVLPYLFGIFFLKEMLTIWKVVGILLMCFAILVKNPVFIKKPQLGDSSQENADIVKKETAHRKKVLFLFLCLLGAFIAGGCNIVVSWNTRMEPATDTVSFSVLTQAYMLVIVGIVFFVRFPQMKQMLAVNKQVYAGKNILVAFLYAITCGGALIFSLEASKMVPASVMFPISSSGNIVLITIFDALFYREKFTKNDLFATVLIISAIFFVAV